MKTRRRLDHAHFVRCLQDLHRFAVVYLRRFLGFAASLAIFVLLAAR